MHSLGLASSTQRDVLFMTFTFLLLSMSPPHVNATVTGVSCGWAFGPFPLFAIRSKAAIIIPAEDIFL